MSPAPVLSIVVAVYNGEKFLPHFFDSLLAQNLSNWELIVVNDGSKDNSEAVIRQYQDKFSHFTLLTQDNQGFLSHVIPAWQKREGNISLS